MASGSQEDHLAYGDYHPRRTQGGGEAEHQDSDRGLLGDAYQKLRSRYQPQQPGPIPVATDRPQDYGQNYPSTSTASGGSSKPSSGTLGSSIFNKFHGAVHGLGAEVTERLTGRKSPTPVAPLGQTQDASLHRYGSFAGPKGGDNVKWYVDGCGYMWAVSRALEQAKETIWILDWWLSPELYLRRPPARNQQYRLDRMLQAAAQRGVKVNIIVYKEVTQALTRKYLTPTIPSYLHSLLPRHTDPITSILSRLGLMATFASLEYIEAENPLIGPFVTVCSSHTKHALEKLHPNISVFRHPDHLPDAQTLQSSFISSLRNISLSAKTASQLPGDALKAIYGMNDDVILYWAHHEKLCLVDGKTAFMGGLDLCYGRWDTNHHPIADCHPSDLNNIVFPGQDFNNARIMDFQDVPHWENNKLSRKDSSRMGWSDVSISLHGSVVEDLQCHFVERWNFIYNEKYDVRKDVRYSKLLFKQREVGANPNPRHSAVLQGDAPYQVYTPSSYPPAHPESMGQTAPPPGSNQGQYYPPPPNYPPPPGLNQGQYYPPPPTSHLPAHSESTGNNPYSPPPPGPDKRQGYPPPSTSSRSYGEDDEISGDAGGLGARSTPDRHHHLRHRLDEARERLESGVQHMEDRHAESHIEQHPASQGGMLCQIVRSISNWSHGIRTEHSIAEAYINVIRNSQHFVYIENQFFITATSDAQKPVRNKIGAAIVERILRAARAGEKYKVIVIMPAVPAFAGDLKDEASLGTRAIMEFQYNSINRGGYSIMEVINNAGYEPTEYIRFYNLRSYDRINVSAVMLDAEKRSGIDYEDARRDHDAAVQLPAPSGYSGSGPIPASNYQQYQQAATSIPDKQGLGSGRWDSVSECYMLGGTDIRQVPWENGEFSEMDAFVSEELYVHSKVLIADDRVVICGSANLNDRSQLGTHDSEIAIVVEDTDSIDSYMDGRPWRAAKFAATLRRQLFRKHLGLIPAQDMARPDPNFEPVGIPNMYDFGSREDRAVTDPLSDTFLSLWNSRARQNTHAFGKIFHPVPHDDVRTWKDYDAFYEAFFQQAGPAADGKASKTPAKYKLGHVVADNFSPGPPGLVEVKELLSTIKGTLVEMPLLFLIKEDIAKEGVGLNAFTEEVYT